MLNVFTKTKPWIVASLLAATSVFAQDNPSTPSAKCRPQRSFEQGKDMMQNQMMPAYNATARIDVRGSWDFWVDGTFIYWEAMQENMELGITVPRIGPLLNGAALVNPGTVVDFCFSYKPGFKVGIGMNFDHDNWDASAEYTWFHSNTSASASIPATGEIFPLGTHPAIQATTNDGFTGVGREHWTLKMDFLDIDLERCYYVGNKLSFRPFFGARGAWIRQHINLLYSTPSGDGSGVPLRVDHVSKKSVSWGIGPEAGIGTDWMLGYGLKLLGDASFDILYTRYNTRYQEQLFSSVTSAIVNTVNVSQNHIDYLRPHAYGDLGIGWGSYFDNNNWHIDLSATYNFQVFWGQDMFRFYTNSTAVANSFTPNGNLYVHGLDVVARFDF